MAHRTSAAAVAAAILAAAAVAGCGAGHSKPAPASPAARAGARLLARSEAALGRVHTLQITTDLNSSGAAPTHAVADIALPGRIAVTLTSGRERSEVRLIGGDAYLQANAAYWQASGATAGVRDLVGHWYKLSGASLTNFASLRKLTSPRTLGRCTLGLPGATTTVSGHATAGATPVTHLTERAAQTTDVLTLASARPNLPQTNVRTGPNIADGACAITTTTSQITGGSTTYGRYNLPVHVAAPADTESEQELNRLSEAIGGGG